MSGTGSDCGGQHNPPGALERIPALALLIGAIISLQVGPAFAITLLPYFGLAGTMLLRMAFSKLVLAGIYRAALLGAARKQPLSVVVRARALISDAVPFLLEFLALKRMTMTTFKVLVGVIALGEMLTTRAWIAVAVIAATALGAAVLENRRKPSRPTI